MIVAAVCDYFSPAEKVALIPGGVGSEWEVFRCFGVSVFRWPVARWFGKSERGGCGALVLSLCSEVPVTENQRLFPPGEK